MGSEKYFQILNAFAERGWAGFEEAFDRVMPRSRTDYVRVQRGLLREPVFSLKAQRNIQRLGKAWVSGSIPEEQKGALERELQTIEAEKAARGPFADRSEHTNSNGHTQFLGVAAIKPSSVSKAISPAQQQKEQTNPKLVFGVIRGGVGTDTLVFIPVERAKQLAEIRSAMGSATTWRDFAEMIPPQDWNELLRRFQKDPENDQTPDPDLTFDCELLPGFCHGDWPDWPEQKMMDWLPPEAVAKYAIVHVSVVNGPFLSFDCSMASEIASLQEAGEYFQEVFARGDRTSRQFFVRDELWEVVDAGIPHLHRVITPATSKVQ